MGRLVSGDAGLTWINLRGRIELGTVVAPISKSLGKVEARLLTVFFFARSPDAPRTIITVLSFNSMFLVGQNRLVN
jgi:hypothetical protein